MNGEIKALVYDQSGVLIAERVLNVGELILFTQAHNLEFLQDSKILEVKQGPYPGVDKDKVVLKQASIAPGVWTLSQYEDSILLSLYEKGNKRWSMPHVIRVAALCNLLARRLGLSSEVANGIAKLALVHDIGGTPCDSFEHNRKIDEVVFPRLRLLGLTPKMSCAQIEEVVDKIISGNPEPARMMSDATRPFMRRVESVLYWLRDQKGIAPHEWDKYFLGPLSHELNGIAVLQEAGFRISALEEFIIKYHEGYPPKDKFNSYELPAEQIALLLSILIVCDVVDNGNDYERMLNFRKKPPETLVQTFKFLYGKYQMVNPRVAESLRGLLLERNEELVKILCMARKASGIPEEEFAELSLISPPVLPDPAKPRPNFSEADVVAEGTRLILSNEINHAPWEAITSENHPLVASVFRYYEITGKIDKAARLRLIIKAGLLRAGS